VVRRLMLAAAVLLGLGEAQGATAFDELSNAQQLMIFGVACNDPALVATAHVLLRSEGLQEGLATDAPLARAYSAGVERIARKAKAEGKLDWVDCGTQVGGTP